MKLKRIGRRLLTVALTAVMAVQLPIQPLYAAAAGKTEYLSELIISYGKNDDEAKNWLTNNGYKVLNQNLNEGGEGGLDALSWMGLASEKRSVFLGYKTTTNADEAITDMKIMNMNGGYDYQAYEKVLEEMKQEKDNFLHSITGALAEYRENYKTGKTKAKIAHDNLNKFRDDDSGQLMGDLLLNTIRTEDEAAWEKDLTKHADMVTILMQGNSTCVSEIMQNLAFAADMAEDSFVIRTIAGASTESDKSNFDVFLAQFLEDHPGWNKDDAIQNMMALYDDDAKTFAASLVGLQNYLSNYTQSDLSTSATAEEAARYFEENEFEDKTLWAGAANLYSTLDAVSYGNASLLQYLAYPDDDYLSNSALLVGYEDYRLPQRAALYPFIAQMSEGQRCLLEYTAMDRILTMGLMDEETWCSTYATLTDQDAGIEQLEPCSVFAEVNRDDFKVGNVAVTNVAQGKEASTGEAINEGLFGVGISKTTAGIFIGGIAMSIAGITLAVKLGGVSGSADAIQTVKNGHSIIKGGFNNGLPIQAEFKEVSSVAELTKKINDLDDALSVLSLAYPGKALTDTDLDNLYHRSLKLTLPGSNETVIFENGIHVKLKDGTKPGTKELDYFISPKGNKYYADGRPPEVDEEIANRYNQFYAAVNPDVVGQFQEATQQLNTLATSMGFASAEEYMGRANEVMDSLQKALSAKSEGHLSYFEEMVQIGRDPDLWSDYSGVRGIRLTKGEFDVHTLNDDNCNSIIAFLEKDHPEETEMIEKIKELQNNKYREAYAINQKKIELSKYNVEPTRSEEANSVRSAWKWFGVGMAIAGLAMSVYSAYAAIKEMQEYYHMDMIPIPHKMVDLAYYEDGSTCYVYYDCTKCNRAAVGMANETLGDFGDLNGDVMKQWLALYTTKDKRAGSPIKAGFTKKVGSGSAPMGKTPLSFFGFDYAVNMTDTRFTYNDKKQGIYLYYQSTGNPLTASAFNSNAYAMTGMLSALGGAGICYAMITLLGRRKRKTETTA